MLADDAKPLIRGMGQGEALEGSVSGENLREARAQLMAALRQAEQSHSVQAPTSNEDDDDDEPPVAVSVRASPLLEMMSKALEADSFVMWQPE